jgi:ABC-type uncharacterized transport system YnjBCD substrate-binding protein
MAICRHHPLLCFPEGTLGNTHFVAIPFNANAAAGAMVFADFLLSPEAQAHKQDVSVWGDPTVLAIEKLRPRTAPASKRWNSEWRRCDPKTSARRCPSRIRPGWSGSRRNGRAAMA